MLTRILMFFMLILLLLVQVADTVYLRDMTAKREPMAVSVKEGSISPLSIETQEIVNSESVTLFAERAAVILFNYRPGQFYSHVEQEAIKNLFVSEFFYEKFRTQFEQWSKYEFNVNNISIKEVILTNGSMIRTPPASARGARIWVFSGRLPTLDRGVGDSIVSNLKIKFSLVYLGPEGGMGIYKVELSY